MTIVAWMYAVSDRVLYIPFLFLLAISLILTLQTRFIQLRAMPKLWRMIRTKRIVAPGATSTETVSPLYALFTAMSTTIGIGNIVGPIVAVGFGGPGALAGFLLATLFGAATTFVEVCLALAYRIPQPDGSFLGGPMTYLGHELGRTWAYVYAGCGTILLITWSSNQSNAIALLLGDVGIPYVLTGLVLAISVILILRGGIQRIGEISALLVPIMFVLYCSACVWILFLNRSNLIPALRLVYQSLWSPMAAVGGLFGVGLTQAMRWGLARAYQSNEAGVGTATFPHSASALKSPVDQGILAMISVYSNGFIATLSGLVILTTGAWQVPGAHFDIRMITDIFVTHFPGFGKILLMICSFLFAYGTILGNSYNGSQCFRFIVGKRGTTLFYTLVGGLVFLGAVAEVRLVWTLVDFLILPVAIPHAISLVIIAWRRSSLINPRL